MKFMNLLYPCLRGRSLRVVLPALLLALTLAGPVGAADTLAPFASDGCSLFPNGPPSLRNQWCDCCLQHDLAYWQGGTEAERAAADAALRVCVLAKTGDAQLAEAMYLGVRAGGSPDFPTWYRWGYGWPYGRGYAPLTAQERAQIDRQRGAAEQLAAGYCESAPQPAASGQPRPAAWATSLATKHLQNAYRLDARVYRSAQPDETGFAELAALGVTDILNLRDYHDDDDEAKGLPLKLHRVEMEAGSITAAQVLDALRVIRAAKGPVLIHCWHGSDRTGTVAAMYRIVFQSWNKEAALDELKNGGYGYHSIYGNIPEFIAQADVAWYRRELGLGAGSSDVSVGVAESVTGTYRLEHRDGSGCLLRVEEQPQKATILFQIECNRGAPSFNSGRAEASIPIHDHKAVYSTTEFGGSCQITFQFSGEKVTVHQDEQKQGCGFGYGVVADGEYKKQDGRRPEWTKP